MNYVKTFFFLIIVDAYRQFFQDFVQALLGRQAPLDIILGYQLRNEVFFEGDQPPLSWSSGTVTTANGNAYDMASSEERERMIDEGLVYWANETRDAIRALDPTALVTAGFFAPKAPHLWRSGDPRLVRTRTVLRESDLDFLDFHGYPDAGLSLAHLVENFGMTGYEAKPVVLGETGAFRHLYASPELGAAALQPWRTEACEAGFDGLLLWYWDPVNSPLVGDNVWGALDGVGEIAHALAPVFTPNPCAVGPATNLALGKPATASAALADQPPEHAVDGRLDTNWGAGDHPPQWIEIDLQEPTDIGRVGLLTEQFPSGFTEHHLLGRRSEGGAYEPLHTFSGETETAQWLEVEPAAPWTGIRWVRVETSTSPSWVSWSEIRVYPPQPVGFVPLPPALLVPGPRAGGVSTTPTLAWEAVPGADIYEVQVGLDADLGSPLFEASEVGTTEVNPSGLDNGMTYHWRVRAVNGTGTGPWSATRRFSVEPSTGVGVDDASLSSVVFYPAYPNPFRTATTLHFELSASAHVQIDIYDTMGRKVTTLLSESLPPGAHQVAWHPANLASGVYYYHFTAGDAYATGTVLHVR